MNLSIFGGEHTGRSGFGYSLKSASLSSFERHFVRCFSSYFCIGFEVLKVPSLDFTRVAGSKAMKADSECSEVGLLALERFASEPTSSSSDCLLPSRLMLELFAEQCVQVFVIYNESVYQLENGPYSLVMY